MRTEPVALAGALVTFITALIAALQGFGVTHWTTEQVSLILALFSALIAAVTAAARSRVTPVAAPKTSVPLTTNPPEEG